ncbi:RecX family transcriptional regulator [Caldicellulosiruptor morganii]|uniref:RecX family transcriptional regulator n=1 Tax=Caldicellulosiruptor morganii TaxID=1387555 RepID=A0ABY7BS49_9FIRM|nr:RecX family transcriptional regulator [Caldicellulosiruptor morganii]WAM34740.1 RecX family transcriptional regulator [Caldicellulosiruptor morganii]
MKILDKKLHGEKYLIVFEDGSEIEIDREIYLQEKVYDLEDIDERTLERLLFENKLKKAKQDLVSYIAKYPMRSEFMYYKYLIGKGYDSATASEAVAYFVSLGYIDEISAAKKLALKYQNSKSSFEIINILRRKGFKNSTISRLNISDENDLILLDKLLSKKLKHLKRADNKEVLRIIKWFVARGYDYNTVVEKIKEYLER